MKQLDGRVATLRRCTHHQVPDEVAWEIVTAGAAAVPSLLELALDRSNGRVASHAVTLLGEIGDPTSAPLLVRLLHDYDGDMDFYAEAALEAMGPAAVPALLAELAIAPAVVAPLLARVDAPSKGIADALTAAVALHGPLPELLVALEARGLECALLARFPLRRGGARRVDCG